MNAPSIPRVYDAVLRRHLENDRQMAFVSGPRQVGKTTVARNVATAYLNWDDDIQRRVILGDTAALARFAGEADVSPERKVLVLDELHHFPKWKNFLKGFFDTHGERIRVVVTGSARLDTFKRGGDSLMGRYFPYRLHPLSVGELLHPEPAEGFFHAPAPPREADWDALLRFGGFPEPFARGNPAFARRWRRLRLEQLVRGDIRDATRITELDQIATLAQILSERSGEQAVFSSLARDIRTTEVTVRKWIATLDSFFLGFCVHPWSASVANSIRKTPKWYARDWSGIEDEGRRNETFLACHLLKAVEFWTDTGLADCGLFYLRDKQKRGVDFLVVKNRRPWFLVEVKTSDAALSPALERMQKALGAPHAFQVVANLPFADADPFLRRDPVVVPARTFLSLLP
jgi:hypothetical protein